MKKVISMLLVFALVCSFCACRKDEQSIAESNNAAPKINFSEDLKAVWLSYYEIGDMFKALDETGARKAMEQMFSALSERGINTLFFHVRAYCDAFYKSKLFPCSAYCNPAYDLLELAVEYAHAYKISLHAWVNPYRVALDKQLDKLPKDSPAVKLYKKDKTTLLLTNGDIFLNPASTQVQKLILNGIREIITNYDVDGIHYDDYFYPSADEGIDKSVYAAYRNRGGRLTLQDYRRENVSALIAATYAAVKGYNPNILFGVSPQCFIDKNKEELFADVRTWLENGSVDYLMPQIYFGFENESAPFEECVDTWRSFMAQQQADLYVGLALYKSGKEDNYASENTEDKDSAYNEWKNHDDIIARQIAYLKQCGIQGFSLYSYAPLMESGENEILQHEVEHLLKAME